MKNSNTKAFLIVVIALVVLSSLFYTALVSEKPKPKRYHVSVVVDNSIDEKWNRFQAGIDQAAKEYNVTLSYITTHTFDDLQEEMDVIRQEVNNGAQGLILQLVQSEDTEDFVDELIQSTSVSLIQTDVDKNVDLQGRIACVLPDYTEMGKQLAKMIYNYDPEKFTTTKIGLVSGTRQDKASKELYNSFEKEVYRLNGSIGWICESSDFLEMLQLTTYCPYLVALDDDALFETSLHLYRGAKNNPLLFGVGYSDKNLKLLEDGKIQEMLVINEYSIGYISLSILLEHLENPGRLMENQTVNTIVVNQNNLFSEEYESILFPISQ